MKESFLVDTFGKTDEIVDTNETIISDKISNDSLLIMLNTYADQIVYQFIEQQMKEHLFKIDFDYIFDTEPKKTWSILNELEKIVSLKLSVVWNMIHKTEKIQKKDHAYVTYHFIIRNKVALEDFIELRIAVAGNVDAGKSTLLGVLSHNLLDNGRGLARQKIFRHAHESQTGRTSSVSHDIMGFDENGCVVDAVTAQNQIDWRELCYKSSKVAVFIDLAGHEKYLRTTIFGLTGHLPDYVMLVIGANMGFIGMTKEHLGLSIALKIPVIVVVTKVDMCPEDKHNETLNNINKILKSPSCRKIPFYIQNMHDVMIAANSASSLRFCPIFQISNVTGQQIELLKTLINVLPVNNKFDANKEPIYLIDDLFSVPGVGTVVAGTMLQGTLSVDDKLVVYGPDSTGQFNPTTIKTIHRKRMPVNIVKAGHTCSIALKKVSKTDLRKGMILTLKNIAPSCCLEFKALIRILHHPTTISLNYQAMTHVRNVRQTCKIIEMDKTNLRTGDESIITLRFIRNPEILIPGSPLIFREGRTKAVGTIISIIPMKKMVTNNVQSGCNLEKNLLDLSLNSDNTSKKPKTPLRTKSHKNR